MLAGIIMSPQEQLLLELVNRAREDPAAEAARYSIDLNQGLPSGTISTDAKQPLAPNQFLGNAAAAHSQDMLDFDYFSHTNLQGQSPTQRAAAAGYSGGVGENIAWGGSTGQIDQNDHVYQRHQSLFLSAGHRNNMLQSSYDEAGMGVRYGVYTYNGTGYNSSMVTENFGNAGSTRYLTGVVYTDTVVDDDFFTIGESIASGTITAVRAGSGESYTADIGSSGGYALEVPDGTYTVTAAGGQISGSLVASGIVVAGENEKVDFDVSQAPPTIPGSFSVAAASDTSVTLTWDDASGETEYVVHGWDNSSGAFVVTTLAADATSHAISGLPSGTRQWFYVEARNAAGGSPTAWAYADLAPNWPVDSFLVTASSATEATLTWADAAGETEYIVHGWDNSTGEFVAATVGADVTSHVITGLSSGTRQWFYVEARNAAGSVATDWAYTDLSPAWPADSFSVVASSATEVTLTWADASGETEYVVHGWDSSTGEFVAATLGADVTSHVISGLPSGARQWYYVEARNSAGAVATQWAYADLSPAWPADSFSVVASSATEVTLTWADASGETEYVVHGWDNSTGVIVVATLAADVTSHVIGGLPSGTRQWYYVEARNSAGTVATSWAYADLAPDWPVNSFSVVATSATEVTLTWAGASGESEYIVYGWDPSGGAYVAATLSANATSHVISGLSTGTRHWYYVEARNAVGSLNTEWEFADL